MPFYKFNSFQVSHPEPVVEVQKVFDTVMFGNNILKEVSFKNVDICSSDYVQDIPSRDEYTLENLLASGVPLEFVNTNHLLDKKNDADMERLAHVKISSMIEDNKQKIEEPINSEE